MSTKKAGGSTRLGRDSRAQRLGIKLYGGEQAKSGMIILRQRGTRYRPGTGTMRAKDDTLFATTTGVVNYLKKKVRKFNGKLEFSQIVSVK
ncbi:MAG: 50S ribosomal protein L27 [Candidatus Buchananbacteria bacterium]|nr:50S ribosomal protein L27 [Candidatus Buchananbacteria bacterium]